MQQQMKSQSEHSTSGFSSMIDIVFLLLIFFILQPFKAPEMRLDIPLEKGNPGPGLPQTLIPVRVQIRQTNGVVQYHVDGHPVKAGQGTLVASIRQVTDENSTVPVVIDADADVQFGHVLYALDQCRGCGVSDVKLANRRFPDNP